MKTTLKKYLKEITIFAVTLFVAANIISIYRSQNLNEDTLLVSQFTLLNKSHYMVKNDKPLLIHFWATWCPTCAMEASNIQTLSKEFEVITIAVQSGSSKQIKEYLHKNNFTFHVVEDPQGNFAQMFNVQIFPTTFIYDKNKNLHFAEVGYTSTLGLKLRMLWASL